MGPLICLKAARNFFFRLMTFIQQWSRPYISVWPHGRDVRQTLGKIDPDTAASGDHGMENVHYWEPSDVMGNCTAHCIEVQDWMNMSLVQAE